MRITIVQGPFLPVPPLRGGAVEKIMLTLGAAWAARGHRVTHVSRRYPGLANEEELRGVRHLRVPSRDAPTGRIAFRLAELAYCRQVRRALPEADILLSNAVLFPIFARQPRHGQLWVRLGRMPKGQLRFYRHAARVQALTEAQAAVMRRQAPSLAERIVVLGSPLPDGFAPLPAETLAAPREPCILYVGRLHPEKGLGLLIEAFRRADLPAPWRLQIVGPHDTRAGGGGEAYLADLRAQAAACGARVAFPGPCFESAALVGLLRQASVFAYPSLAEQGEVLSLSVLEAMSQGAVPLVSRLETYGDVVVDGSEGLVFDHRAPDAPDRLAACLRRASQDPALLERLGAGALGRARNFTLDRIAERYLDEFRILLGQAG